MRHHRNNVDPYYATTGRRSRRTHRHREARRLKKQARLQAAYPTVTGRRPMMLGAAALVGLIGVGAITFAFLRRRRVVCAPLGVTNVGGFASTTLPATGISTGFKSALPFASTGIASTGISSTGISTGIPTTGISTGIPTTGIASGLPLTGASGLASSAPIAAAAPIGAFGRPSAGIASAIPSTGIAAGIPRTGLPTGSPSLLGKLAKPLAAAVVGKKLASPGMKVAKKSKWPILIALLLPLATIGGLLLGLRALKNRFRRPKVVGAKPPVVVAPRPVPVPAPVPVGPVQPVVASRWPLLRKIKKTKKTFIPAEEVVVAGPHPAVVRQPAPVRHQVRTQYIPPPVQHAEYVEEVPVVKKKRFGRRL